jgi:hypothetical protein
MKEHGLFDWLFSTEYEEWEAQKERETKALEALRWIKDNPGVIPEGVVEGMSSAFSMEFFDKKTKDYCSNLESEKSKTAAKVVAGSFFINSLEEINRIEKELIESCGEAIDVAKNWLSKPSTKKWLIVGGLCFSFFILWQFSRVDLEDQSGDIRFKKNAGVATHKPKPKFTDLAFADQGNLFSDNVDNLAGKLWRKSIFRIENEKDVALGYILGLKGRVCIMPKHYYRDIKKILEVQPLFKIRIVNSMSTLSPFFYLKDCKFKPIDNKDLCVMTIPLNLNEFPDIVGAFAESSLPILQSGDFSAACVRPVGAGTGYELIREKVFYSGPMKGVNVTHSEHGYIMRAGTRAGMCGIPVITADTYCPNTQVFGVLVAGHDVIDNSYFVAVTREEVLEWTKDCVTFLEPDMDDFSNFNGPLEKFEFIGVCSKPPSDFAKNTMKRSPLFEKWGESVYLPSALRPRTVVEDGIPVLKEPKKMALSKYNRNESPVSEPIVFALADSYYARMVSKSRAPKTTRKFTFEEVVVGVPGTHCEPISKKSSAGWDWVPDGISKKDLFGDDGFDLTRPEAVELRKRVDKMESDLIAGQLPLVAFMDKLKSEKRLKEKVRACKTRLFTFPPIEFLILCKMYLMAFNCWCIENCVLNGLTIGLNPFGVQWTMLAEEMLSQGGNIISGDFSGWDGCLQMVWFYALFRIIKHFYAGTYSKEEMKVLDGICEVLVHSIHIWVNENGTALFYKWLGCMCSGIFITGLGNSIINQLVIRYAIVDQILRDLGGAAMWPSVSVNFPEMEANIVVETNGDDNLISPSPLYPFVTQQSLTESFAKIGFTYTDETKTGAVQDYRKLTDVFYLKRTFRWSETGCCWDSPHEEIPVAQSCYWMQQGGSQEDLRQTVRMYFLEESQWGEERWNYMILPILPVVRDELGWLPAELTWQACYDAVKHQTCAWFH